jgi:hypothetical protein
MLFKHPVLTAKKTQRFSIAKTRWSILFEEIITVYSKAVLPLR